MKTIPHPLICSDGNPADSLFCRGFVPAPSSAASNEIVYLPAGIVEGGPTQNGKVVNVQLLVTPDTASALEQQRKALIARGKRAYFDFNHDDGEASFWPEEFTWRDGVGVVARGEWSQSGREAIEGKKYRGFSPICHPDNAKAKPAKIICEPRANPNMGGLVNNQAFNSIPPFFAKDQSFSGAAGEHQNKNQNADIMNEKELAALRAKIEEQSAELTALKAKEADTKLKKENSDLITAEIKAKEHETKATKAQLENEELKKDLTEIRAKEGKRLDKEIDTAIDDAVKRGAIGAKDEETKKEWRELCKAQPASLALLAKQAANPAVAPGRITPAAGAARQDIQRGAISGRDAVQAYAALVAKNAAIKNHLDPDKAKLAKEAGAIFCSEMKGNEDAWMSLPLDQALKGADVTNLAVGTLAGTLVLQRNLPLMTFNYPMLKSLFTDFSDAVGLWMQTEMTRIVITPAVEEYDPTPDTNGRPKGFVVAIPAQTVDVPIQLTKHVGIPMVFGVQTLASTIRNLFQEQSAGAINALGGYFVNMATALMTSANFNAYAQITDAACGTTAGSTAITLASTAGVWPGQEISGAGIPVGARIASVVDATDAIMTLAATAIGGKTECDLIPRVVEELVCASHLDGVGAWLSILNKGKTLAAKQGKAITWGWVLKAYCMRLAGDDAARLLCTLNEGKK